MASSPRPFRSQTLSQLLKGYRQIGYGVQRWLREGGAALIWGVQVALYPVYVGVQTLRSTSRRLVAATVWRNGRFRLGGAVPQAKAAPTDTPIVALLLAMQVDLCLSLRPYRRSLSQILHRSGVGQGLARTGGLGIVTPTPIQGIACDLATAELVLVGADNRLVLGLTPHQQEQLQRAIVQLLAEYGRHRRHYGLNRQLQTGPLPLPPLQVSHYLPLRWFYRALEWMQTSPLAIATNLFGEADLLLRPLTPAGSLQVSPPAAMVGNAPLVPGVSRQSGRPLNLLGSDEIEAQTTLLHYIDHPLMALLRSLDTLLVGLEGWFQRLLIWLRRQFR
ncbi:MAG: hypothetical protein KGQ93_09545 [Cyanobacteria bacterium REEB459]|nr:hypothetical protein [Cyanobacteria bacterium REEB459]